MEEDSNDYQSFIFIREGDIRAIESNIQAQLGSFDKLPRDIDTTFLETSNICENVRDQILYHEDEPHLSKTHNNCRRIFIASDLFTSICSIYGHIVDNEFTKIIKDIVQWEKYKRLSKKIMHKMQLETKREKFFAKEAEIKLLKSLEDEQSAVLREEEEAGIEEREGLNRSLEESAPTEKPREDAQLLTPMEVTEPTLMEDRQPEAAVSSERERLPAGHESPETLREKNEAIPSDGINDTLASPLKSRNEILSDVSGNLTEMRAESITDISRLECPISNTSRRQVSFQDSVVGTSVRELVVQDKTDDLNRILQILEDQNLRKDLGDILQPTESTERIPEVSIDATVEELQPDGELGAEENEEIRECSEEWNLPNVEPVKKTRRRNRLIIDEVTIIPEYAARALNLNRNINIERVQVFEGPPNILQGLSVNHLMRTPAFKNTVFQNVRSSKLSELYTRHLELEKKPVEHVLPRSYREVEKRRDDVSNVRANVEIVEEVGQRLGMHLVPQRSDLIVDVPPDKSHLQDFEIPTAPPKESLIGKPVSRLISSGVEPPEEAQMERINAAPILPIPRVQHLQGQTRDPKPTSSWFISSKQNPPSEKYREFNYLYEKIQQYWSLFEMQGMEKCITLREFLSLEGDKNVADYLTAMRVVDKLSIQRKLRLDFKNNDIHIRPLESPCDTDEQLKLTERSPHVLASF